MSTWRNIGSGGLVTFAFLAWASVGSSGPDMASYAGDVIAVDKSAGRLVVGDMGPLLANGTSEIARRSVQVTSSTEFAKVRRASGMAPSGFVGDFVETKLPAWEVKPGDFVAIKVKPEKGGSEALKITVVDTSER